MPADVPLVVDLADRLVVVVGGGRVAESKTRSLLTASGAASPQAETRPPTITIVSPELTTGLAEIVESGGAVWRERPYADGDLDGAWLVVAATSSAAVNAAVAENAERRRVWCIRADRGQNGTAALVGAVRRGSLVLAVSTSGTSPALAAHIRRDLSARYGAEWGELADLLGELRRDPIVRAALAKLPASIRRQRWHAVIDPDIVALIRLGRRSEAKRVATACLCSSSD